MRSWLPASNPFFQAFGLLMAGVLWVGCASSKKDDPDKQYSTLRLHMETTPNSMGSGKVKIIRSNPITVNIEKEPFLDEGFVLQARVMQTPGGPAIGVEFTDRGALRLQMATSPRPGRRIAIWSRWEDGRWLAAHQFRRGLEDGILVFVPDASLEEMERIVRGLNNMAIKLGNQPKPPKPSKDGKEEKKAQKRRGSQDLFEPSQPDGVWEP